MGRALKKRLFGSWNRIRADWHLTLRIALSCIITFLLIDYFFPGKADLTGTLSALLVVQVSIFHTVRQVVDRVTAVISGVIVSALLYGWLGYSVFSVGLAVVLGLIIASAIGLGDNKLEAPISALLILSAGRQGVAAEYRIFNTFIGAGVGALVTIFFPAPPPIKKPLEAIGETAEEAALKIEKLALALEKTNNPHDINRTLNVSESFLPVVEGAPEVRKEVRELRRAYLLNPHNKDMSSLYRVDLMQAISVLEQVLPILQKIVVSLEMQSHLPEESRPAYDERVKLREAYASIVLNASFAVRAFGTYMSSTTEVDDDLAKKGVAAAIRRLKQSKGFLENIISSGHISGSAVALSTSALENIDSLLELLDVNELSEYQVNSRAIIVRKISQVTPTVAKPTFLQPKNNANKISHQKSKFMIKLKRKKVVDND